MALTGACISNKLEIDSDGSYGFKLALDSINERKLSVLD